MSKWWKCDLQTATPAWNFELPTDSRFDLTDAQSRRAFAVRYMETLVSKGIEVIGLADHNVGDWIDLMVEVGREFSITVFPGSEITTGTGADGVHLIILGDPNKSSQDFDRLIATLGFDEQHPRFRRQGEKDVPGVSSYTLIQILDKLPEGYLAIAPHALTDNGIASAKTIKGDIRWRALHHPRLAAIDVGDGLGPERTDSFNSKFRRRDLADFPCLKQLAFVATSDAYSLDNLGRRYTWIRMAHPSIEGLRQAFLDFEARIICSNDDRLPGVFANNPNVIRHGWIESVSLGGQLGNSTCPLNVAFHPGLNVLIGGRGSGKSTIVAALRHLYAANQPLPDRIQQESDLFSRIAFPSARLSSVHRLESSQESQSVVWTSTLGSHTTTTSQTSYPTLFRVRVVSQKELYERVSANPMDPMAASRSFLAIVDDACGLGSRDIPAPNSWWHRMREAQQHWTSVASDLETSNRDVGQLTRVQGRIQELYGQIAAFDSPEARGRRDSIARLLEEEQLISERMSAVGESIKLLEPDLLFGRENGSQKSTSSASTEAVDSPKKQSTTDSADLLRSTEYLAIESELAFITNSIDAALRKLKEESEKRLAEVIQSVDFKRWKERVASAYSDRASYLDELRSRGIDPDGYQSLQRDLVAQQLVERRLTEVQLGLSSLSQGVADAWNAIETLLCERRVMRQGLIDATATRSGGLHFAMRPLADTVGWVKAVRDLLGLRADGFIEDVPQLAEWLWECDEVTQTARWAIWREALVRGDLSRLAVNGGLSLRPSWQRRIESLDEAIRLRLAVEFPDDFVAMQFLREGGNPEQESDWQEITRGSPGQRTAAMLSFVLNHGNEPLVLDQPEDDLDTEWVSQLVVRQLRRSRWKRQIIVVTHNANIPVNGDAERVIVMENRNNELRVRQSSAGIHMGPIEIPHVRTDIQNVMEGGSEAFEYRERRYSAPTC